jgi:uncharacterized membrane protein YkvA (DUF1232 family)
VKHDLARRPRGFSAVPFLGDLLALVRLLRDGRAGWGLKLIALLALVYVVSPIDAFPEAFAPYIAWLDDVGLVLALRLLLARRLEPYRYPLFEAPAADHLPAVEVDAPAAR